MKKILFPFQPGKENKEAFVYAAKAARNMNAELIMLNAFDVSVDETITQEKYKLLLKEKWMKAYNSIADFNRYYVNNYARIEGDLRIKTDYRFINEKPETEIFKILEKEEVDLLVLGMNDPGFLKIKLSDILNHRVLRKSITSVFLIPDKCPFKPIKRLVFAIDLHKHYTSRFMLYQGIKLSRSFDASVHFLHFSSGSNSTIEDKESYEYISQLVKQEKKHILEIKSAKDILTSIQGYISENSIDCLVMIKHHRNIFENLIHPSHAESLITKSAIPVLILIEKEIEN